MPNDNVLTLFARDLQPIKYSHRGHGQWNGIELAFVAQIDGATMIVLDCRWSLAETEGVVLSPEQHRQIDDWIQGWIGLPVAFPPEVQLVPWHLHEHSIHPN